VFSTKRACPVCGTSYAELDPRMFSYNSKHGWCTSCVGTGLALTREQRKAFDDRCATTTAAASRASQRGARGRRPGRRGLPDCHGARLNPMARAVSFQGEGIHEVAQWSVTQTRAWIEGLSAGGAMSAREPASPAT
jgi:excinuclease ABC subunit A